MNALLKFLKKLNPKDKIIARDLINRVLTQDLEGLDVTKLQGYTRAYRVKSGRFRIIYEVSLDNAVEIVKTEFRNEGTYKDL